MVVGVGGYRMKYAAPDSTSIRTRILDFGVLGDPTTFLVLSIESTAVLFEQQSDIDVNSL